MSVMTGLVQGFWIPLERPHIASVPTGGSEFVPARVCVWRDRVERECPRVGEGSSVGQLAPGGT